MSEAEKTQGSTGRLLAGRYRLGEVLGRGGMGTVWRAVDETLGRTVAVKELRFPSSVDEDEKRRLVTRTLREAKAIARIRSHGAVTVYDVVDEDDRPWIVMELVEGRSLAEHIRDEGPLTPQRAAEVGLAVLDVLRDAHREGVLHRDVKPSNVLLEDGSGRVVLTDFGIAKVEGDPSVTSTGMLVGAPSYISPERARGKPPGPPADLWSLGALLYAAVEGRPPYDKGSAISTLTAVMTEPVPPPKQAGDLEEVIFGLLLKEPEQRLDVAGARALLKPVASGPVAVAAAGSVTSSDASAQEAAKSGKGETGDAGAEGAESASKKGSSSSAAKAAKPAKTPKASKSSKAPKPSKTARPGKPATAATAASASEARSGKKTAAVPAGRVVSGTAKRRERVEDEPVAATATAAPSGGGAAAIVGMAADAKKAFADWAGRVERRTLTVAGVVLAAVVALVAVVALAPGSGEGRKSGKTASSEQDGGKSAPGGAKKKGSDGGKKKDDRKEQPGGTGEDDAPKKDDKGGGKSKPAEPADGPSLPDDYTKVTNKDFHFTIAMPDDFEQYGVAGLNSGAKYSDGGLPKIQVDFSSKPLKDAAAGWRAQEPAVKSNSSGYKRLFIKSVDWRGYPTVGDWQFERDEDGQRVRVLNRGFRVDDAHGYAIMITCKADKWDDEECRSLRKTAFSTFEPAD
jgi:serine/threonine protein kinase